MIEQAKRSVCVWQRKQKAHVWTWYILVWTACCQIRDRQSRARPDARTFPSGRFTLEVEKAEGNMQNKNFLTLAS